MAIGNLNKTKNTLPLVKYLLGDTDQNGLSVEEVRIVGGSFSGREVEDLADEFNIFHSFRPHVAAHAAHFFLTPHPDDRPLSDREMRDIGRLYADEMEFDGYVTVRRDRRIHVGASRCRLDGGIVSGFRDRPKSEVIVRLIEEKFGLIPTKSSWEVRSERRSAA